MEAMATTGMSRSMAAGTLRLLGWQDGGTTLAQPDTLHQTRFTCL
ncbi:hypothetical protein XBI1_70012 [Xenorhabdus bovienii str. Intermedium]|uniref:Uncharacterized protein n=1 Tax=Xenorhabdus bovienii str. Intermedium TaxID=1379677 RepID=A0A077QQV6_XENBV|nr:hypothetical protein XBI1_70012 [Xenorhabdus bovienii str. Intermedium]